MTLYDYKTVAAPRRPSRFKGVPKGPDSFARTLEEAIQEQASLGWEYLRAENLPSEEKSGWLSRRQTVFHSVLIFRRARRAAAARMEELPEPMADRGFAEPAPARGFAEPSAPPTRPQNDPDAAALRLEPEMQVQGEGNPRLGPADR